jgi:hypothetical protein
VPYPSSRHPADQVRLFSARSRRAFPAKGRADYYGVTSNEAFLANPNLPERIVRYARLIRGAVAKCVNGYSI